MSKLVPTLFSPFLLVLCLLIQHPVHAAEGDASAEQPADPGTVTTLDTQIQDLKKEILDLNRDLFLLEEDLLFPANTQFNVFVSMDIGMTFDLDSVQLRLDDKVVGSHLYTERELKALKRGGVHRLYTGNLTSGEHELVAFFVGKGPKDRDYKRAATIKVTKGTDPQFVELKISDKESKHQPEFKIKVWEAE
ncbi:MAG: AraC family transcriptional regulator [Thioalkalispiraceae bacterium]